MSEDARTLWVGNLHEDVTDELVYELFLQTGPLDKLFFPTEGEGKDKKHKGIAYVLFKHAESVQFAKQVLDGTKLFDTELDMKARSLPITYRSSPAPLGPGNPNHNAGNRFRQQDNNSLRGGFNRNNTWHGRDDFTPRGRGGGNFRQKGPGNYNNQNSGGYNSGGYNNYNNQGYWMGGQQQQQQQQQMAGTDNSVSSYSSTNMEDKRQRLLQQQNVTIQTHQQSQMTPQMYNLQQQTWDGRNYTTTSTTAYATTGATGGWNNANSSVYQAYGDQYNNWYAQQQQQQ